jgi:hypothetical protein
MIRKTNRGAQETDDQDRSPTKSIRQPTENRHEDDLHPGVNPSEPANLNRCGVKMFRIKGQHRDDDAEAHHVDENGEEDDEERRHGVRNEKLDANEARPNDEFPMTNDELISKPRMTKEDHRAATDH